MSDNGSGTQNGQASQQSGSVGDDECPVCGGEGFIFDCFDGCCIDAEIGCDDCTSPCPECAALTKARGE